MSNKKKWIIAGASTAAVLLAVYIGGAVYYSNHFFPGTYIDGTNYGNQSVSQVKEDYEQAAVTDITLKGRDGAQETVALADIGYTVTVDTDELSRIKSSQNQFGWIGGCFGTREYEIVSTSDHDDDMLNSLISQLDIVSGSSVTEPQDAYISKDDDGIRIIPEVAGTKVDTDALKAELLDALQHGHPEIDLEEAGCYLAPKILSDAPELVDTIEKLGKYNDLVITYDFGETKEVLHVGIFADWLSIEDNEVVVDAAKAREYVQSLSAKYDTYQQDRQFKTTNRGVITVGGGIYGWLIDVDRTTNHLLELMNEVKSEELDPVYWVTGRERGVDIGDTYIEINLNEQHMWFYKDGQLFIDTPIVTGLPTPERETPTGVFCVWSKERQRYLRGDDYELWIEYWLPIDWTGVGIHDSYWQSAYGSNIYTVYGSHGCINTPEAIVSQIYNNVELYTPVIVYKA